jgi:hypothetical protein
MRGRWFAAIAVASLALNVVVLGVYLYQVRLGPRRPRLPHMKRVDRERLKRMHREAQPGFESLMFRAESLNAVLLGRVSDPGVTREGVESLCREVGRYHGAMRERMFWQVRRELESLPPDMRAAYLEMLRPGRGMRMMRRMGRHPCPPPDIGPEPGCAPPPPPGEGR